MALLIGMSQEVRGKNINIDKDEISIGRKAENDVVIDNPTVSGRHCTVIRQDNKYTVKDLGSTNGTRVNARDITEAALKPKDIIQVGSIEFMFDVEPGETIETEQEPNAEVEVAPGPAAAPESFGSISPFGARGKETKGLWFLLIAAIGLLALVGVVFFFIKLITES